MGDWISTKEHLPDPGQRCVFYTSTGCVMSGRFSHVGRLGAAWFTTRLGAINGRGGSYTATHWIPLPEPPRPEIMQGIIR